MGDYRVKRFCQMGDTCLYSTQQKVKIAVKQINTGVKFCIINILCEETSLTR